MRSLQILFTAPICYKSKPSLPNGIVSVQDRPATITFLARYHYGQLQNQNHNPLIH